MSSKCIQINPPKRPRPLRLRDNYGVNAGGIYHINAYSEEAESLKMQFLKDGVKYLRSIGYALAEKGFIGGQIGLYHE